MITVSPRDIRRRGSAASHLSTVTAQGELIERTIRSSAAKPSPFSDVRDGLALGLMEVPAGH